MRYKEIIRESAYSNITDIDKIIDQYYDVLSSITPFYRGMIPSNGYILGDGTQLKRAASETLNYVNILSSYLPSWQGWPSRDKSFICSNRTSFLSRYGTIYMVYPLEYQTIAVSSMSDFWGTMPDGYYNKPLYNMPFKLDVEDFNQIINNIIINCQILTDDTVKPTGDEQFNPVSLITTLTNIVDFLKKLELDFSPQTLLSYLRTKGIHINEKMAAVLYDMISLGTMHSLNSALDPEQLNTIIDFKSNPHVPGSSREVWFSGKALFVHNENHAEFVEKLKSVEASKNAL
jgi:hypothetical protein